MTRKNTLQDGSVRYIVFKEDDSWYGVGLEFNIVESGDDPREVLISLLEGVRGYVESAKKIKARPSILNQKADPEYEKLWQNRLLHRRNLDIYTTGIFNIHAMK